ncbi:MAG: glycosyltransferase family 4 protein [Planctomycetota bacterium]
MSDSDWHVDSNGEAANFKDILRVTVILTGNENFGIARFLLNQWTESRRFGIQFGYVCLQHGIMTDALQSAGADVTVCHGVVPQLSRLWPVLAWMLWFAPFGGFWSTLSKVIHELRAIAPDVVYTQNLPGHLLGGLAGRRLHLGTMGQIHGSLNEKRMLGLTRRMVSVLLYALFARGIAISNYVRQTLWGPARRKTEVVYNSVDVRAIQDAAPRASKVPGRLVMVGRLVPLKKFETAIEAVLILTRQGVSCSLDIIGGPVDVSNGYFMRLKRLVEESGLKDRVSFWGVLSPPYLHVASAEVFISCATIEGFGYAVVEAMACGTPVVVADAGAPAEYVVDGCSGLQFRSDDPSSLARRLKGLLGNSDQRVRIAAAAREQVEKLFPPDQHMAGIRRTAEAVAARTRLWNRTQPRTQGESIQS